MFIIGIPKTLSNIEDAKQLIKSSGSIGANYIEANENIDKKENKRLINEAIELKSILSAIIKKLD